MEETVSNYLFNYGANNDIIAKAELLELEHRRYRDALERIKTNCLRGAHKLGMTADGVQAIADIAMAALEQEGGKQ